MVSGLYDNKTSEIKRLIKYDASFVLCENLICRHAMQQILDADDFNHSFLIVYFLMYAEHLEQHLQLAVSRNEFPFFLEVFTAALGGPARRCNQQIHAVC